MNKLARIIYNYLKECSVHKSNLETISKGLAEVIIEYVRIEINHTLGTKEKEE